MKMLFVYPALACVTDAPRLKPDTIQVDGLGTLYVYRKTRLYLDTETRKARYAESDRNTYCYEVEPDILANISTAVDDAAFIAICNRKAEWGPTAGKTPRECFPDYVTNHRAILADTEGYTARESETMATKRADRDKARAESYAEQARVDAERKQRAHDTDVRLWRAGESIEWRAFEELCKQYHVTIPIQTLGAARRNVETVCKTGYSVTGKSRPNGILEAANALTAALA